MVKLKFYGGFEAKIIYFLILMGLGIFFFLFIFIGALALAGHVSTKSHESLPTTMLPVGIASLIVINLFALAGFGSVDHLMISTSSIEFASVLLWGYEVWNFAVVILLLLAHPPKGTLSVWAYGFPLGLFATSTIQVFSFMNFQALLWVYAAIAVMLNILWIYAWMITGKILKKIISVINV